jgi:hypothetical protein
MTARRIDGQLKNGNRLGSNLPKSFSYEAEIVLNVLCGRDKAQ